MSDSNNPTGKVGIGKQYPSLNNSSEHVKLNDNIALKKITDFSDNFSKNEIDELENYIANSKNQKLKKSVMETIEDGLIFNDAEEVAKFEKKLLSAIRIAGKSNDQDFYPLLIELANDPNVSPFVYDASIEALANVSIKEVRSFLVNQLSMVNDSHQQSLLLMSLSQQPDVDPELFLQFLSSTDKGLKESAIMALGEIKSSSSVGSLIKLFSDVEMSSKILITQSLLDIGSPEAKSFLSKIASESEGSIQRLASKGAN